jgi:hypothetical protein
VGYCRSGAEARAATSAAAETAATAAEVCSAATAAEVPTTTTTAASASASAATTAPSLLSRVCGNRQCGDKSNYSNADCEFRHDFLRRSVCFAFAAQSLHLFRTCSTVGRSGRLYDVVKPLRFANYKFCLFMNGGYPPGVWFFILGVESPRATPMTGSGASPGDSAVCQEDGSPDQVGR